jgi:hypothetical protein
MTIFVATLVFAQVPTSTPEGIGHWLVAFAAIVVIANQTLGLFKGITGSAPQMVQLAKEFVTRESYHKHCQLNREHHEKIEARVSALERKLESDKDEIIAAGEARSEKIQYRISTAFESIAAQIGELRGIVGARKGDPLL